MLTRPDERICLDARPHGVVLARPFGRAVVLALAGALLAATGWPGTVPAGVLLAGSAVVALRAVWRWRRTRLVVTPETLFVVHGTLRRRGAAVPLHAVGAVEVEQSLAGRLLGYATLVAGELEIPYVARPERVYRLVERLSRP